MSKNNSEVKVKNIPFSYSHFAVNDYDFFFHLRPLEETKLLFEYGSKMITDAGIHWDRVHLPGIFSWNVMEPVKGKYDWTIPDLLVKTAQNYNINLLPNLWLYAAWDQKAYEGTGRKKIDIVAAMGTEYVVDDTCPIPPRYDKPHDMEAYRKWIMSMVERYDGDGVDDMPGLKYPIKYWEPMNEVWGSIFWVPAPVTSHKSFAEMTKITCLAAKKAYPECKIVLGNANERFYRAIMELGVKDGQQYFDIINLHCYAYDQTINSVRQIRELMSEYGLNMPIWITEFGAGMAEPPPFPKPEIVEVPFGDGKVKFPYAKPFIQEAMPPPPQPLRQQQQGQDMPKPPSATPKGQAIGLIKNATAAFFNEVERVFFVGFGPIRPPNIKLTDPLPGSFGNYSNQCMLDREGNPRMVYYTALLFMSKLDAFKKVEKVDIGKGTEAYKYIMDKELNPESEFLYVLWSDTGASATLTDLKSSFITYIETIPITNVKEQVFLGPASDPQFRVHCLKVTDKKATIKLSEEPVIVEV